MDSAAPAQSGRWAHALHVSVRPPAAQLLQDCTRCQKWKKPFGKQAYSWIKVTFAKQVEEEMQKHHQTCTPPAKGGATEHVQDKISAFL